MIDLHNNKVIHEKSYLPIFCSLRYITWKKLIVPIILYYTMCFQYLMIQVLNGIDMVRTTVLLSDVSSDPYSCPNIREQTCSFTTRAPVKKRLKTTVRAKQIVSHNIVQIVVLYCTG